MLTVHELPSVWGLPSVSPFCLKLTTWLRMAGLEYRSVATADLRRAPNQKVPYVEDGDVTIGDSGVIIEYLSRKHGIDLDAHLDATQRGQAHLIRRTLEESLYFVILSDRWLTEEGWRELQRSFFGTLPPLLRTFVPPLARRKVTGYLWGQGTGRRSEEARAKLGREDVAAVAAMLKEDFFFGRPSTTDAIAYGFLENVRSSPLDFGLKSALMEKKNLIAFLDRMKSRYWS